MHFTSCEKALLIINPKIKYNMNFKIVICLSLVSFFAVYAQDSKKKPSWTETMPERKDTPAMKMQIDKDDDFGMDRSTLGFGRDELSSRDGETNQKPSEHQLTNKIEIQKKLDVERKKNAAQLAKIERLEAEKIELQKLAKQKQEAQKLAAQSQEEQDEIAAQKLAAQSQEEQDEIAAQKLAAQSQEEQDEIAAQELAKQRQEEQDEIAAQKLSLQSQDNQEEVKAQSQDVKKESFAKIEYSWKKIKNAAPVYPAKAERANKEGWVDIEITIDINGNVVDSRVVKSSKNTRIFDKSALKAVRKWKYDPPTNYGVKEQISRTVRMRYEL